MTLILIRFKKRIFFVPFVRKIHNKASWGSHYLCFCGNERRANELLEGEREGGNDIRKVFAHSRANNNEEKVIRNQ